MPNFLPLLILIALGGKLAVVDYQTHRLPNRLVSWLTVTQLVALTFLWQPEKLQAALLTALATTVTYAFLFLISRGSLGMGDVKFSFPLGLTVGWYVPSDWLLTILLTFVLAGFVSIAEVILKRKTLKSRFAFGPYMYLTSILVVLPKLLVID
jgi:leader peptidase (prepilin peptidase)/N-methyltransferase